MNVKIPIKQESETLVQLEEELSFPASITNNVKGIVIFAHGSGSSRHSPRNHSVAQFLNNDGLATLLVDLLTQQEEETDIRTQKIQDKIPGLVLNKFNIKLLSKRLLRVTDWLLENEETKQLANNNIGYFGASTGAAAALSAEANTLTWIILEKKVVVSSYGLVSSLVLARRIFLYLRLVQQFQ